MRTVVVGVDGSPPSVRALEYAARLVEALEDAELVVAHARYLPYLWMPDHVAEDEFADVLDAAEARVRDTAEDTLRDRPVRWRLECRDGEASQVLSKIVQDCEEGSCTVVGRRGWSTVRELLLGSVSNRLVHGGDCPVLLVP